MWDNRATAHRAIPGKYTQPRRGIRTTVFGTKPKIDPSSESRDERAERLKQTGSSTSMAGLGEGEDNKVEGKEGASIILA
jgi:sulfonate dioxygenase